MTDENIEATHTVAGPSINIGGTTYYRGDPVAPRDSFVEAHPDFFDPIPENESKIVHATVRSTPVPGEDEDEDKDGDGDEDKDDSESESESESASDDESETNDAVESTMDLDYGSMTVHEIRAAVAEHEPSDPELRSLLDHEKSRDDPRKTLISLYESRLESGE